MRTSARAVALLAVAAVAALPAGPLHAAPGTTTLFADDFEAEQDWEVMEEPWVCWGLLQGTAGREGAAAHAGAWGYQAWANEAALPLANHVFGAFRVADEAHLAPLRYELWATRDPATNDSTQAGPEFGVQVTHLYPEGWRTTTFGFQYVGSPDHAPDWNLWVEDELLEGVAEWRAVHTEWLEAGAWYRFVLEADLTIPAYRSLVVEGPHGVTTRDLTGYAIAREPKWQEAATWVHVDASSLWNTCGVNGTFQARVWYDDVRLDLLGS